MPVYIYECPKCGEINEVVRPVHQCNLRTLCACGTVAKRNIGLEQRGNGGVAKQWSTGNVSMSMGTLGDPAQEQAKLRAIPGCATVEVTPEGYVKTFSRRQKEAVAKHLGMADFG